MQQLKEQIPKWTNTSIQELQNLLGKLETGPGGPLRDYILDDCFNLATSLLNELLVASKGTISSTANARQSA